MTYHEKSAQTAEGDVDFGKAGREIIYLGDLEGPDGNAYSILAKCRRILEQTGRGGEWVEFHADATSANYEHLLAAVHTWFLVVEPDVIVWRVATP
jgi:hypothetical protein